MNSTRHQSLFFVSLPELQKLCAATVTLSSQIPEGEARSTQIKICRQLLFLYQEILSAPVLGTLNQISVVMAIPFYESGICQAYTERHGATLEAPQAVTPDLLQTCLSYTLTARLAPRWNKAGHLLVQGKDFLSQSGRQNAVVLDLNVSERQLCISVEPCSIRLPPPELGDFDISANIVKLFDSNESTIIQQHSILSNWCYVLPSMKMGQIINITHIIPPESPFRSYKDFQMHWKSLYGYILPEDLEETKIYLSVYFKPIGERFFTYPLSCIRSQPVQYFPRTDAESVVSSFLSDMKSNFSQLCGFPVKMTSKALYATKELSRASVQEIKPKPTKLDGEMLCVVSLTKAPPRKPTLPGIPSPCSTENSHWMECLVKEPGAHRSSSSSKSAGGVSIEATEKSVSNKQIPGVPEQPTAKSLGTPVNSAFKSTPPKVSKIIPIFKGKLMQMNGKITNQTDKKKRENVERHSPIVSVGVSSSVLSVHKSSTTEVFKHIQNMPVKTPNDRGMLQMKSTKTHTKHGALIFRWKTQASRQSANSDFSENSPLGGNSHEVNDKKANSPFFIKNVGPVLQKSSTSPCLNTHESPASSARRGKKFASENTTQFLEKHQSKEVHLQICKLDNEMTDSSFSLQQRKRSNKGAGLNIHESVFKDTVCMAKREENKAACHSKDCSAETTNRHAKPNFEQVQ
uniref:Chromosome 18 open reading frame 63 n=1 Tax=Cyanoderma ruficeps TaxID=181631 RepID=A0A8C3R481_9PASS